MQDLSAVFWDVMPHSLVYHYQCFRGICWLNLQGRGGKMEAAYSYKMFTMIYKTIEHHTLLL
jgi:hypothetical protein